MSYSVIITQTRFLRAVDAQTGKIESGPEQNKNHPYF
jgi:hypothetical protein